MKRITFVRRPPGSDPDVWVTRWTAAASAELAATPARPPVPARALPDPVGAPSPRVGRRSGGVVGGRRAGGGLGPLGRRSARQPELAAEVSTVAVEERVVSGGDWLAARTRVPSRFRRWY